MYAAYLHNVQFIRCSGPYFGGALKVNGKFSIDNSTFQESINSQRGSALYIVTKSSGTLSNVSFIGNRATLGGAVYVEANALVNFVGCLFDNNYATQNGGNAAVS